MFLSHLVKIAIESQWTLSEEELEQIVDVWKRKPRRRRRQIVVNVNFYCDLLMIEIVEFFQITEN